MKRHSIIPTIVRLCHNSIRVEEYYNIGIQWSKLKNFCDILQSIFQYQDFVFC